MSTLLQKVLTDGAARNSSSLEKLAVQEAGEYAPWVPEE